MALPPEGRRYIAERIELGPSRGGQSSHRRNLTADLYSPKMRHTVCCESGTVEEVLYAQLDSLRSVAGYLEQPGAVRFKRYTANGVYRADNYTVDTIVVTPFRVFVVEAKLEADFDALTKSHPQNWVLQGGRYRFVQAVQHFDGLGLQHVCWHPQQNGQLIAQNLRLLHSAEMADAPAEECQRLIRSIVSKKKAVLAVDLLRDLKLSEATQLMLAIARREISVAIDLVSLADIKSLWLSDSDDLVREVTKADRRTFGDETLANTGAITGLSPKQLAVAGRRLAIAEGESSRTARRYRAMMEAGAKRGVAPLDSLAPKVPDRETDKRFGPKLPPIVEATVASFLDSQPIDRRSRTFSAIYDHYVAFATNAHPSQQPVSRPTLEERVKSRSTEEQLAGMKHGRRGANHARAPSDPRVRRRIPERAFERCIVDNYHADCLVKVFETETEVWTARPIVTALVDLATTSVLAVTVSLEAPSKRSVGRLLRLCARLHGRLFEELVTDRGSDFRSIFDGYSLDFL